MKIAVLFTINPLWKTSAVRETHQSRVGRRQRQWQRGSSLRRGTSAGSSSSLWRSFCFTLFSSLFFCLETVPRRSLPLLRVDCVGLFVWTVSVSLRCWGWGAPWPPHSAVRLLRFCQNITNICRSSLIIFFKNRKIIWDILCKLIGWSQVENRNLLTDQACKLSAKLVRDSVY